MSVFIEKLNNLHLSCMSFKHRMCNIEHFHGQFSCKQTRFIDLKVRKKNKNKLNLEFDLISKINLDSIAMLFACQKHLICRNNVNRCEVGRTSCEPIQITTTSSLFLQSMNPIFIYFFIKSIKLKTKRERNSRNAM